MHLLTKLFPEKNRPTPIAQQLFVMLLGIRTLAGKLPKIDKLPFKFRGESVEDLFVELHDKGYILGNPDKYKLNLDKFKLSESTVNSGKEPTVMELLKHFVERHKHFRKDKNRKALKPQNDQRALLRLRHLVRQFNGHEVKRLIDPFFQSDTARLRHGPLSIEHFANWAPRQLKKK